MKNLLPALLLFISAGSFAQKNQTSISFGPSFADPLNTSGTQYFKKGIGAAVRGYYPVSRNGSLMANVSYVSFGSKPKYSLSYSLSSFTLGYKTFFNTSNFYIYANAGIGILATKDALALPSTSQRTTMVLGLGLGYSFPVTKNSYIDFSPGLNFNNAALFGRRLNPEINIGYRINLFK